VSASVIRQILAQPQLPERVRWEVLEYVEQKSAGAYGHNPQRVRRFASAFAGFDLDGQHRLCRTPGGSAQRSQTAGSNERMGGPLAPLD
jgi:hypothetical protein